MDIVCKQCNATYSIPRNKLPKVRASADCKRCGGKIVINAAADETTGSISTPPASPAPSSAAPPAPPASDHDNGILEVFPEMSGFSSAQYDLAAIMKPTKKGKFKTRINKFKVKILTTVKPTLDRMLARDERVLRVAAGTAYYPIEIFLGNGSFTMLYNRYAIVATNQRMVMINTNSRMTRTSHYLFQYNYEEIKKVSRGLFRTSLTLTPKQGKRRTFTSMKSAFTAELLNFIKPRMDLQKTMSQVTEIKPNLCPACFARLGDKLKACESCHAAFKTPAAAALRSALLPGLGDLYLGHRFLGVLEMVGAVLFWLLLVHAVLVGDVEVITIFAVLLIFFNGLDALLTLHMAKKGYTLAKKQPVLGGQPQLAANSA